MSQNHPTSDALAQVEDFDWVSVELVRPHPIGPEAQGIKGDAHSTKGEHAPYDLFHELHRLSFPEVEDPSR